MNFTIETLGTAKIQTPIQMSSQNGDGKADYEDDANKIYLDINYREGKSDPELLELAGPREKIYFNPARTHAAICTCGGICPGLNNVIRAVVRCFWYRYGVRRISGIPFGYLGLLENSPWPL
ncbi:MAG: 6-phosphofructokinase, partial [Spirochaetales bacterium]|nr:6-phosphofructokinase [Candidatus Physcosoma equi]